MRTHRILFGWMVLGSFFLVGGVAGCNTASAPRTAAEKQIDQELNQQVRAAFTNSPAFKFPDVQVAVFKSNVQLSGFVLGEDQKKFAGRLAKDVPGVLKVENGIALKN